jgi:Membrane-associated apoptosis protein
MSKIVERFAYLKDVGEGLLHRLYYSKYYFATDKTRPSWLKDATTSKLVRALVAKFPDFPDTEKVIKT